MLQMSVAKTGLMKYGYARVPTDDQNADMQHAALKKAECKKAVYR
jgi:DNA invertase Pin-like site-specific DNA recombinase